MRNLKIICHWEVSKIDKPPSLSVKTPKNMTPGKDGKWNIKHLSAITVAAQRP